MPSIDEYFYGLFQGGGLFGYGDEPEYVFGYGEDEDTSDECFGYGEPLDEPAIRGHDVSNIELVDFYQYYETMSYRGGSSIQAFLYTVICYGATEKTVREMAKNFFDMVNRKDSTILTGKGLPICNIGEPYPSPEEHNWICPIDVRVQTNLQ